MSTDTENDRLLDDSPLPLASASETKIETKIKTFLRTEQQIVDKEKLVEIENVVEENVKSDVNVPSTSDTNEEPKNKKIVAETTSEATSEIKSEDKIP